MSKPRCLTHTARFSRVSVNQTQAVCSSFHQGEIRGAVEVTGSKPCSKQLDPCFGGRKKPQPTDETQADCAAVSARSSPRPAGGRQAPQHDSRDAGQHVHQVSAQNLQLPPCLRTRRRWEGAGEGRWAPAGPGAPSAAAPQSSWKSKT